MAIFTLSELGWQSYIKMAGYFTWCWLSELKSSCLGGSTLSTEPFNQLCCIDFNKYFFILSLAIQWIERIENYCDFSVYNWKNTFRSVKYCNSGHSIYQWQTRNGTKACLTITKVQWKIPYNFFSDLKKCTVVLHSLIPQMRMCFK